MGKIEQKKLIRDCISGKSSAHKELYDTYASDMYKICCTYSPDRDSANDYLQEGFLKVFQNLHKYKPTGSLGGWIRRLIVNNCIDLIRRDHWSKTVSLFENQIISFEEIRVENDFEKEINSRSFFEIIGSLPLGYRTILNLYYLEDCTHKEISEMLSISIGTSKSQLSKAKKYLKKVLLKSLTNDEIELYVGRLVKEVV